MKYTMISAPQLFALSLLMAIFSAMLVSINSWYQETRLLPEVHVDANGTCVKVVNFENAHAFNCADVNVILRRYIVKVE